MGSAEYTRHVFQVQKTLKSYSIYELIKVENGKSHLTPIIRIEEFRGYSKATDIKHYLRLRNSKNWQKCEKVTGLRATQRPGVYHGNWLRKDVKSLMLFQFSIDGQILVIDVFNAFYPYNKGILQKIIQLHLFLLKWLKR